MLTEAASKSVLVAGATGRLGLVAVRLLERGHRVRAMSRDPESAAAVDLRKRGAEIVYADFDDPGSIEEAARGVDAAFATGTAHKVGPDGEVRHGRNFADAIVAADVSHLIYSSGDGAAEDSPLPLFRAKFEIERYIRSLGTPYTILAPVYFMENLFNPWNLSLLHAGTFPSPIPVDLGLQQLAIADLASFASLVIERPSEFEGWRIELASDEVGGVEAAAALSQVLDRQLEPGQIPPDQLPAGLEALFGWLAQRGHEVDVEDLHREYPELRWHRYADWARSQRARFRDLCAHPTPVGS